jgi:hypothetical protein
VPLAATASVITILAAALMTWMFWTSTARA